MVPGWVSQPLDHDSTDTEPLFLIFFRNDFLLPEDLEMLDVVRDLFLGPAEDMTAEAPAPDPDNPDCLTGGTAFERCGQHPVKDSARCYSLTVTHQRARGLVGPTGAGKFYGGVELMDEADDTDDANDMNDKEDYLLNLEIRGKVTKVCHG